MTSRGAKKHELERAIELPSAW